jgi:crotonobetainyl-CoA:carnitine CoA-transferase CaiB-like acyl-CoA transferase
VVKVQPPGGEGAYHLVPLLPNIYVDGNRSKRGVTLELRRDEDRRRLLDLVAAADVVIENAVEGGWERLGLGEDELRARNPSLIYGRAKGFGLHGPLATRPSFDYVVQAATGMEMVQGGGRAQPVNFTANDYCTGLHLAAGIVLALLARARGVAVTSVVASLMTTATVFESEQVAQLAVHGELGDDVGADLRGPSPGLHLYEAGDGWVAVCAVTGEQGAALGAALGLDVVTVDAASAAMKAMTVDESCALLGRHGIAAARSVHPGAIANDPQVRARGLLATTRHPGLGPYVQVGTPLWLSDDAPAVKGGAPVPVRGRGR